MPCRPLTDQLINLSTAQPLALIHVINFLVATSTHAPATTCYTLLSPSKHLLNSVKANSWAGPDLLCLLISECMRRRWRLPQLYRFSRLFIATSMGSCENQTLRTIERRFDYTTVFLIQIQLVIICFWEKHLLLFSWLHWCSLNCSMICILQGW